MKYIEPARLPEANIQAEFYRQCKYNGINICLEYKHYKSRFDAIVYNDNKKIIFIIEIKSYKTNKSPKTKTKQMKKYESYGVPVILITRLEQIEDVIDKIALSDW